MAVWQFDLHIVPTGCDVGSGATQAKSDAASGIDVASCWQGVNLPAGYEQQLAAILPAAVPWDPEWAIFGTEDGTRVDVIRAGEQIQDILMRLDARSLEPEILVRLVSFVRCMDCELVTKSGVRVEPRPEAVWVEFVVSPAARFVADPASFFDELQRQGRRRTAE